MTVRIIPHPTNQSGIQGILSGRITQDCFFAFLSFPFLTCPLLSISPNFSFCFLFWSSYIESFWEVSEAYHTLADIECVTNSRDCKHVIYHLNASSSPIIITSITHLLHSSLASPRQTAGLLRYLMLHETQYTAPFLRLLGPTRSERYARRPTLSRSAHAGPHGQIEYSHGRMPCWISFVMH